jgi:multiple sugar transport system permease protein
MRSIKRPLFIAGVVVLCAWTIVPIYLVALGGLGGDQGVYTWPKPFWPRAWSAGNFSAFLTIQGIWPAMLRSVEVAAMCMGFSIALGAPAGYALARSPSAGPMRIGWRSC